MNRMSIQEKHVCMVQYKICNTGRVTRRYGQQLTVARNWHLYRFSNMGGVTRRYSQQSTVARKWHPYGISNIGRVIRRYGKQSTVARQWQLGGQEGHRYAS